MSSELSWQQKFHQKMILTIQHLQRFTDRSWYPPFVGILALIDAWILIIPTDGIIISSVMLKPRKWVALALCVAIGSSLGLIFLFYIVDQHGLPWILELYPQINQGHLWQWSENFFDKYGLLLVFLVALTPVMQQPAIILASLAHTPLYQVAAVVLSGRILKYLILAYVSSHSPRLLSKLWGAQTELEDVGIHIDSKIKNQRSQPE